jgi:hypothetical protein
MQGILPSYKAKNFSNLALLVMQNYRCAFQNRPLVVNSLQASKLLFALSVGMRWREWVSMVESCAKEMALE